MDVTHDTWWPLPRTKARASSDQGTLLEIFYSRGLSPSSLSRWQTETCLMIIPVLKCSLFFSSWLTFLSLLLVTVPPVDSNRPLARPSTLACRTIQNGIPWLSVKHAAKHLNTFGPDVETQRSLVILLFYKLCLLSCWTQLVPASSNEHTTGHGWACQPR